MEQGIGSSLRNHLKHALITGGLEASFVLDRLGLLRQAGGLGAVFTLHHVRPFVPRPFEPNRHLEISPEFLDLAIRRLRQEGYVFVPLNELPGLMAAGKSTPRFVAFTLDDANRNNLEYALPVFARHDVPFTVFVTQGLSERTHTMWWETLAELFGRLDRISFDFGAGIESVDLAGAGQRQQAFDRFAALVHRSDEAAAVGKIDALARSHGLEPLDIVRSLIMDAEELKVLAANPLASLGAHTVSHRALSRLSDTEAAAEMSASADYIASITGTHPTAIAYPYGTRDAVSVRDARIAIELGFTIGVTTQPGTITPAMGPAPTLLPRLSLNGFYQKPRYASALASGIPMWLEKARRHRGGPLS
ncbi:polysaccharide deacetylase [Rhizobium tubonense]|uniref:Chitooligosaccharide deacetylase n=1 Tax=Rhizobium tubonense TaxID=484088 RepID=A0A2W4CUP8_9HYPH|nr:polysaccharide deacetylase family protein [Rhizobium tubonense]PZM09154.1 polysaccharide deacetylase [Rhizobium tubonense]